MLERRNVRVTATLSELQAGMEAGLGRTDVQLELSLQRLDGAHSLLAKWGREPGLADILEELYGRLLRAFNELGAVGGLRILDIACGSNSSRAPSQFHLRLPGGKRAIESSSSDDYFAAVFEPWFCRILETLEAQPVGVDRGDLSGETFEYYGLDLGRPGALDILPSGSFDAVHDSRLFGSPEFRAQFPAADARLAIAREIAQQESRLLKPGGVIIHSDAQTLVGRASQRP
jgi:SAM-dependent methyltransferase